MNVTSNITIVPAQEAFLVDATPTTPSADRWIEAKPSEIHASSCRLVSGSAAEFMIGISPIEICQN